MSDKIIRVGISIGDLNGIGIEVILKTFEDARMMEFCTPVIFGATKTFSYQKKIFKLNTNFVGVSSAAEAVDGKLNIVNLIKDVPNVEFGKETKAGGTVALQSLQAATEALKKGEVDVLVTAPINKYNIQTEEFKFPGHTDYLATQLEGDSLMFMVSDGLRIGLLTDHVAVKDIAEHITPELIERKIETIHESLRKDFSIQKPKIAMLGINPHSGDNGVIGKEDDDVMKPTIQKIFESGKMVFGPYAADSFFGSDSYKQFDAVVAAYHDQGLIPFKTLSFGKGVNYTAGLSKVRTSPDHGTAYGIAGKGEADPSSFIEALFAAIKIYKNREEYKTLSANPLKKSNG
ncbi:4-hydroxythreonine-4-phosphate dehydrogenase [Pustulibacterium marinum]|uniref:4-hydroxythreonine-4-phosphate dehydrogenase n=1 Tax=Pustulibacterium marinum TaxID=1224947 RepID=A0A1I7EUJ4_9FLAO|nr:4-hydroxythreonine-4-phosphate dehydrogenase PdxA [Pustulibacterium marinum]SFU27568.1 4-hydroxythreonine-4-phosphate dehydrogenase [Pustulibacterium marinum]